MVGHGKRGVEDRSAGTQLVLADCLGRPRLPYSGGEPGCIRTPKKGLYFGGNRPEPPKSEHQWKVLCLDLATGKVQWEKTVHRGAPQTPIHLKSTYGAETPVTDGERVYALFGNLGVFAFTLEGGEVWSKRLSRTRRASAGAPRRRPYCMADDCSW